MISPYVRRLRLGQELRALRTAAGITHAQMAAKVSLSRQQISRLELGQAAPDLNDIMEISTCSASVSMTADGAR